MLEGSEGSVELAGEAEFVAIDEVEGGLVADLVGEAGSFHGWQAALAPATDREIFYEAFFEGVGWLEIVAQAGEEGGEPAASSPSITMVLDSWPWVGRLRPWDLDPFWRAASCWAGVRGLDI